VRRSDLTLESLASDDWMHPVVEKHLWNLFGSDWTLGESSPITGKCRVRSVLCECMCELAIVHQWSTSNVLDTWLDPSDLTLHLRIRSVAEASPVASFFTQ
jgi:hypothetical protein